MQKTFSDFFSGVGLFQIGMERAGWKLLLSVDNSQLKEKAHKIHFGKDDESFLCADIFDLHASEIPQSDLIHASFPCTDLSVAGSRMGTEDGFQSSTIYTFLSIIREMGKRKPWLISLENVKGLLTSNKGDDLYRILKILNALGYATDIIIIDASFFVPQSRERIFIFGIDEELAKQEFFFRGDIQKSALRPLPIIKYINEHKDLNWAFFNFPALKKEAFELRSIIDTDEDWWPLHRTEYLMSQMYERHRNWLIQKINDDQFHYVTAFRRMRMRDGVKQSTAEIRTDGISGCLRTSKGGSAKQIIIRSGKGRIDARLLSPKECAALMGAPEYKITPTISTTDWLFCFGDAVCAYVVEWIANNYFNVIIESKDRLNFDLLSRSSKSITPDEGGKEMNLSTINKWIKDNTPSNESLPYLGRLFAAIVLLDNIRNHDAAMLEKVLFETDVDETGLNPIFFVKRSVKGHTSSKIRNILSEYGYSIPSAAKGRTETGRTSGGTKSQAQILFNLVSKEIKEDLGDGKDPHERINGYILALIELIQQHFLREKIKIHYNPNQTIHSAVAEIIKESGNRKGSVAQYLVAAKLRLRFSNLEIPFFHANAADVQTAREGDFTIGNIIFHVTVSPTPDHYIKCHANMSSGKRVYLLVASRYRQKAILELEDKIGGDFSKAIVVESIEDFIGQNLDEIAISDGQENSSGSFSDLIKEYNEIINDFEIDKSIMIEII